MLLLAAFSVDQVGQVADGIDKHPQAYFLALIIAAVCALWATLATVVWWSARTMLKQAADRIREVKRERDEARTAQDREAKEGRELLVQMASTSHGLARLNERLQEEADTLEEEKKKFDAERRRFRDKRTESNPGNLAVVAEKK